MSTQGAQEFIEQANQNAAIRQAARERYADIAGVGSEHGFDFTRDEFDQAMRERKAIQDGGQGSGGGACQCGGHGGGDPVTCQCGTGSDSGGTTCQCGGEQEIDSNTNTCQCGNDPKEEEPEEDPSALCGGSGGGGGTCQCGS
jgi:hypothetical protein